MTMADKHVVIGTAGHIDHGKSTLVQALTGTDPDRWEEEKRRGITIDLGFAHAEWGAHAFSFVDVPGHERFVHNMLAGATGIDLVLLVVAADESVMPQTREHLAICNLLGLDAGVVALTRIDLAEEGFAELAEEELRETLAGTFLASAEIVPVSGVTGAGLEKLRQALSAAAQDVRKRVAGPWPRLGIDRVFAARGFGAVVTGTLQGGELAVDDQLSALPGGSGGRVRGLQVHGQSQQRVGAHCRVAVNMQGALREGLRRGMVLCPPGLDMTTLFFDAQLKVIEAAGIALEEGMRVRVHHGTAEVMARLRLPRSSTLEPGREGAGQLRLEAPLAALPGDRFILRRFSPITTIGGGIITDLDPPRWRRGDERWLEQTQRLAAASALGRLKIHAEQAGPAGLSLSERAPRIGLLPAAVRSELPAGLILFGDDRIVSRSAVAALRRALVQTLKDHHRRAPLEPGPAPERLRKKLVPSWAPAQFREFLALVAEKAGLVFDRELVRLASHRPAPEGEELVQLERLVDRLDARGLEVVPGWELQKEAAAGAEYLSLLIWAARCGRAVRVKENHWISGKAWDAMVQRLREHARAGHRSFGVPEFKELFGLSRKHAIPLLERLDDAKITRRAGNERVLRLDTD